MVFTLHRYILGELLRVFILTSLALTLILSLGMILEPVSKYGIGPKQVIHLIGYFLPITLTFVLPIAALFASSLVYGRFASDNELNACRASGVSTATLIYPGLALAIVVATANLILSFHVIPAFVKRAEKSYKADAQQILFRNIQRKGFYKLPEGKKRNYRLYADHVDTQNNILSGIIVVEVKNSEINRIITAEKARVDFNVHKRFNEVEITAYNTYQMGTKNEGGFSARWTPISAEFPQLLDDNIKFKKIEEMKAIRTNPMLFSPIEERAREVYGQFVTELLAQDINSAINRAEGSFYGLYSEPNSIKFTAGKCIAKDDKRIELSQEVVAIESNSATSQPLRTLLTNKAVLHIEGDELDPTLTMEFHSPTWQRPDGSQGLSGRAIIRGLLVPQQLKNKYLAKNILHAVEPNRILAALDGRPSEPLKNLENKLRWKIRTTLAQIKAEIHWRLVFGTGCIPMILIGIGLGVILRGGHILTAFAVSCVPAAILMVGIMMGKNITKNPDSHAGSGIILMWAVMLLLIALAALIYRKLLKN